MDTAQIPCPVHNDQQQVPVSTSHSDTNVRQEQGTDISSKASVAPTRTEGGGRKSGGTGHVDLIDDCDDCDGEHAVLIDRLAVLGRFDDLRRWTRR